MLEKNRTEAATAIDRDFMIVLALDRHLTLMRQCEPTRKVRHCPHVPPTTQSEEPRLSAGFEVADSIRLQRRCPVQAGKRLCLTVRLTDLTCDSPALYPFARRPNRSRRLRP